MSRVVSNAGGTTPVFQVIVFVQTITASQTFRVSVNIVRNLAVFTSHLHWDTNVKQTLDRKTF